MKEEHIQSKNHTEVTHLRNKVRQKITITASTLTLKTYKKVKIQTEINILSLTIQAPK